MKPIAAEVVYWSARAHKSGARLDPESMINTMIRTFTGMRRELLADRPRLNEAWHSLRGLAMELGLLARPEDERIAIRLPDNDARRPERRRSVA